jgi:hypothetical protein
MIIQPSGDALFFITQPELARLAGDLLERWSSRGFAGHPRRDAILLAAREHDNGWIEEDDETHVDGNGEPLDFISVPAHVKHRIWPRRTARLAERDPYAAALVAQHALTVHEGQRGEREWAEFFNRMEAIRGELLATCPGRAAAAADEDYPFVRIADLLSLVICNGWRTPASAAGTHAVMRERLEVSPDPFGGIVVPYAVGARRLERPGRVSASELRDALAAAPVVTIRGEAVGVERL